jgi:hypothetical protein
MSSDTTTPRLVNGRGLNHRKLTPRQRIRLAADLASGRARLAPSISQACLLLNVMAPNVRAELRARGVSVRASNGKPNGQGRLAADWQAASATDRLRAVQDIGVSEVWETLCDAIA